MKKLLLIPLLGLACLATSCRTFTPVNPMTMKPDPKNLPCDTAGECSGYSGK